MLYYLVGEVKIEPLETAQPGPSSQREPRYIELNTSYNKSGLSGEFQFQSLPLVITYLPGNLLTYLAKSWCCLYYCTVMVFYSK